MAWTASKVFRPYLADVLDNTTALDLGSDTFKVALYDDSITPDQNVTSAQSAYGAGVWSTAGGPSSGGPQRYETGQWDQGGKPLLSQVLNSGSAGIVFFDAADTVSGSAADLSNVVGCLVYDTTVTTPVANQGICYLYFSGANSVVNGTFTVVYSSLGILRATLS